MSINLYGKFETFDIDDGQWKDSPLFYRDKDGTTKEADVIRGGRNTVDTLFGKFGFDDGKRAFYEENEEDLIESQRMDSIALEKIDEIVNRAVIYHGYPKNASLETIAVLKQYASSFMSDKEYLTDTATYTLDDLEVLEALTGIFSPHAKRIFDLNFRFIFNVLNIIGICYDNNYTAIWKQNVRVILYAI